MHKALGSSYDKLSVPAMRNLIQLYSHPIRQVFRHFETRGYSVEEIHRCYDRMINPPKRKPDPDEPPF